MGTPLALALDTLLRPARLLIAAAAVLTSLATAPAASAAIVPAQGGVRPTSIDMRVAVSVTNTGSTRWMEVTVPPGTPSMWLVPVRPGAEIAWAPTCLLDALDGATAPSILPPEIPAGCTAKTTSDRPAVWATRGSVLPESPIVRNDTAAALTTYANAHGYPLGAELTARVASLYEEGWRVAAVDLSSSGARASSPTLRVSDDAGPALPLALAGTSNTNVTVLVLGDGKADVAGARSIDPHSLHWGTSGSNYEAWRRDTIALGPGNIWIRESSSATADDLALLTCGEGVHRHGVVTRLVGRIPERTFGTPLPIAFTSGMIDEGPEVRARVLDGCTAEAPLAAPEMPTKPPARTETTVTEEYTPSSGGGCSGGAVGTTGTTYEDDSWDSSSEGCSTDDSSSSTDSCSSSSSGSSSGSSDDDDDDDGWDSDDDSNDDGWDSDDDGMAPKAKTKTLKKTTKKSTSPVSRYALLAVALLLPFRRRGRPRFGDQHTSVGRFDR